MGEGVACVCVHIYIGVGFGVESLGFHSSATLFRNKKTHHTNSQQRVAEEGVHVCFKNIYV